MSRKAPSRFCARMEFLEERLCLASSVGWDGVGQGSASLTYYIGNAPASVGQATFDSAIRTALAVWSSVANITFSQTNNPNLGRSLDFTFKPLDGSGGTLAQGYFPDDVNPARIAGDVQFDSSESWEVGDAKGNAAFDLVLTAVHEIGHALGLDYSQAAGSVMADSISPSQQFQGLSSSDKAAILSLYAPASSTTTTTTSTPTSTTPTTTTTTDTPSTTTPTTPTRTPGRFAEPRWFFTRWHSRFQAFFRQRPLALWS